MPKKLSILGYGWLGTALAKELQQKDYQAHGSTTTEAKLGMLSADGVVPHLLRIGNRTIHGALGNFLDEAAVLVVAFPPGLRHEPHANYAARIKQVVDEMKQYATCNVLLLSSVGVFGQSQGIVNENSTPKPDSEVGKQLAEAEAAILSLGSRASIVRLGGLVGEGRHPAKQLSGRKNITHPNAPTNLVHQKDVVRFLCAIIAHHVWGHVLHCVSPIHHNRKDFYTKQCALAGLEQPEFSATETTRNKQVEDTKSKSLFGFDYTLVNCSIQDC